MLGAFRIQFEKTTLREVQQAASSGSIAQQGDAAGHILWICYTAVHGGAKERIWIISHGEMGGPDHAVTEIADGAWNEPEANTGCAPGLGQFREQNGGGIRTQEGLLAGPAGVANDDHGAGARGEVGDAEAMTPEEIGDARRTGRREAQTVTAIAAQQPANRGIAEAAVAVEKDEQTAAEIREFAHV